MQGYEVVAGGGSEGRADIVAWRIGLRKAFIITLACPTGTRSTVQPSAGTSKGLKTHAITLVLSFRHAGVPVLKELVCFGPNSRGKYKHTIS